MKAAKDRREDVYDPERKDNILGRSKTRLELWERPDCGIGQSVEVRGELVLGLIFGPRPYCGSGLQ